MLKGIVDRDGNHPSIVIWTIVNENWGVDLVHDLDHRTWLKRMHGWLKVHDPTRPLVDNSPLAPSFHLETDIADHHYYPAIPDRRDAWDAFVDNLADRFRADRLLRVRQLGPASGRSEGFRRPGALVVRNRP